MDQSRLGPYKKLPNARRPGRAMGQGTQTRVPGTRGSLPLDPRPHPNRPKSLPSRLRVVFKSSARPEREVAGAGAGSGRTGGAQATGRAPSPPTLGALAANLQGKRPGLPGRFPWRLVRWLRGPGQDEVRRRKGAGGTPRTPPPALSRPHLPLTARHRQMSAAGCCATPPQTSVSPGKRKPLEQNGRFGRRPARCASGQRGARR